MERIFTATESDELTALAAMLYGFPTRDHLHRMDSLGIFPGYVDRVINEGARLYRQNRFLKRLFVNGVEPSVPYYIPLTEERLRSEPFSIPHGRPIVTQVFAKHTKDQTDWMADRIIESEDKAVAVVIYPFHLLRAFSTLVRSLEERGRLDLLVFPIPATISPADQFIELDADGWALMPGELRRVVAYRNEGLVATFEVMRDYLDRLWNHIQ